jgi:hypothetical protein
MLFRRLTLSTKLSYLNINGNINLPNFNEYKIKAISLIPNLLFLDDKPLKNNSINSFKYNKIQK